MTKGMPARKNEQCIIGLPSCNYQFSSRDTCFIAFGFSTSKMEVDILKTILSSKGIEPMEALSIITPGKSAFCAKICSQIIDSRFCITFLNQEIGQSHDSKKHNPNVHMEYGLMLGFHKYVIPFQREGDALSFNVAGLDTIKYSQDTFSEKATHAIDIAIQETAIVSPRQADEILKEGVFRIYVEKHGMTFSLGLSEGDRVLTQLANTFDLLLLEHWEGDRYTILFDARGLTSPLASMIVARFVTFMEKRLNLSALAKKLDLQMMTEAQVAIFDEILERLDFLVLSHLSTRKLN